jgi:hypothetical protein
LLHGGEDTRFPYCFPKSFLLSYLP